MTVNLPYAYLIADELKALRPEAVVVFGGVVATPLYDQVARHPSGDFVVIERGETALPALLRAIEADRDPGMVGNLAYQAPDGRLVKSGMIYPAVPVQEIPFP